MKRYSITKGTITQSWSKSEIEASEFLSREYQIDDGEVIFSSFDKSEAEKEFAKYYCDCVLYKTQVGYEANIDYAELSEEEGEIDENGDFCIMKISNVAFDELYTPYKYYGDILKFCEGDYRYMNDFMLFVDDFETIEELTEEEYNELVKQFVDKIIKLK